MKMEIFEIGRGAKLIPQEYWHQYVLKYDFQNPDKPFIVSEIGKDKVLFNINIDSNEIQSEKWIELLERCECNEIIKAYLTSPDETKMKWRELSQSDKVFNGKWITNEIIEVLDYNSNHGNWISSIDIPGKFRFELDLNSSNIKNCNVMIPVEYTSGGPGYYSIYFGRFELTRNQILIWQNDIFPTRIKYKWFNESLELQLFDEKIRFEKE
jgi:hypothetical protein